MNDPNNIAESLFYKNEKDALSGLYGIYDAYQATDLMGTHFNGLNSISDDLANNNSNDGFRAFELSTQDPFTNPRVINFYVHFYNVINRACYVISRVEEMNDQQITVSVRKRIIAESSFLRNYAYFILTDLYRDIPFYKTPQNISSGLLSTTLRKDIIAFLKQDLIAQIPNLPISITASEKGRVGRGAAITLLGQLYLYDNEYQNAEATLKPLLSAPYNYSLFQDYSKLFTPAGEFSTESIFEINFDGTGADKGVNANNNLIINGSGFSEVLDTLLQPYKPKNNLTPASKLVDSYLCIDGKPIANSTVYGVKSPLYATTNSQTKFDVRDPRLKATVFTASDNLPSGKKLWNWTNLNSYAVRKYVEITSTQYPSGPQNFYVYRFADVLLMYAEAQNEILASPDATVYDAVNKIRRRVGMPDYPINLSKDQMRERIRDERRWEFGLEYHRYFDLKRWGIIQTAIVNSGIAQKKFTNPRDYVWPIPQRELDVNANMVQAAEWR
ncbi:MAG: RagB/SusD family nutrient uptake outer membrane protein [Pedobacter agri]